MSQEGADPAVAAAFWQRDYHLVERLLAGVPQGSAHGLLPLIAEAVELERADLVGILVERQARDAWTDSQLLDLCRGALSRERVPAACALMMSPHLHWRQDVLELACRHGLPEVVRACLARGGLQADSKALSAAIRSGHIDVCRVLLDFPGRLDRSTALNIAFGTDHTEIVELLLTPGSGLPDFTLELGIRFAVKARKLKMLRHLLTPLPAADRVAFLRRDPDALMDAIEGGSLEMVRLLVEMDCGSRGGDRRRGCELLCRAVMVDRSGRAVRLLLELGELPGRACIHEAFLQRHQELPLLFRRYADAPHRCAGRKVAPRKSLIRDALERREASGYWLVHALHEEFGQPLPSFLPACYSTWHRARRERRAVVEEFVPVSTLAHVILAYDHETA